jgi:cytochrome c553
VEAGEIGEASRTAQASVGVHQPRALAYDAQRDTLYLAGYGSDQILGIEKVSQASVHMSFNLTIPRPARASACAPDGMDVAADGTLFVHCQLSRRVVRVNPDSSQQPHQIQNAMHHGPELAASPMTPAERRGAEIFRRGNDPRLSGGGIMACANCHAEGRTDGLSWRIEGHTLQTPLLGGRLVGTHPYKWDGKDADLKISLTNTVGRLGGSGLSKQEVADLRAFVEGLPAPRAPKGDPKSIARGRKVFESTKAACSACHDEDSKFTDGERHDFDSNLDTIDTPSLVGLAHSAPYYHDGSARTLRALLMDNGSIHQMGGTDELSPTEMDDLVAYLESL